METSLPPSDLIENKIEKFDAQIIDLQDTVLALSDQLRIMQMYIIKMAQNQAALTKQMAQWPYLVTPELKPSSKKEKPEGSSEA